MIYTITSRRQLSLSPEEIDLLIHACWTTRKQVQDEIHEATDEGDYGRVGQMEEIAAALWEMIMRMKAEKEF